MAQIKRRGPNIYTIIVYLGRDKEGKRKWHYETFHGGKTEAKQRGAELEVELKRRTGPKHAAMNLGEYLNSWLEDIRGTVSDRAYETYKWHVSRIMPVAGKLAMYNLNTMELQKSMVFKGLSPRSIRGVYGTLRTALRQAVAWGILNSDPTVGLRTPRVPRVEKKVLTLDELQVFLETAKGYKYYLVVRLLALTGMRLGEVLGLMWQDIDFKKETLTIKRAADGRNRILKETKNVSSERVIKLDTETISLLSQYKKDRKVVNLKNSLIFSHDGRVVREDAIRRTMNYVIKKTGLVHISPHNLRHTAGSLMLDAGYSLPAVAALLGHSSTSTTAAVYAHAVKKNSNNVADVFDN